MLQRFFLIFILLFLFSAPLHATELSGLVTWIYDGDTIKVENIGKVRLLGIDTPEYQSSSRDSFYTRRFHIKTQKLREISQRVKKYLVRNLKGKRVKLKLDLTERDKYGRLLAYVYLPNGKMLNQILLEKGLASVFRRYNFRYKQNFLKIEKRARRERVGLWKK